MLWVIILKPYAFNILNDSFKLYSLPTYPKNINEEILPEGNCFNLILTPSLTADFSISAHPVFKNGLSEHYAAALCAAAFLIFKRGLPLDSILFETPDENIEVFNTGTASIAVKLEKCKLLTTNSTQILGSDVKYTDVDMKFMLRTAPIPSVASATQELAAHYLLASEPLPAAVVFYENTGNTIKTACFSSHAKYKPSALAAFAAAACAVSHGEAVSSADGVAVYSPVDKRLVLSDARHCLR